MPFNFFQGTQVGLQLYSLHNHFSEDIPGTFKIVRDWGFKYVEGGTTSGLSLEAQKKLLDKNGLKLISFAVTYKELLCNPNKVIQTAKYFESKYVTVGWIPHNANDFGFDEIKRATDFFNINPDATAPSNTAYTASSALHTMFVFQKSDIKRPDDSNPATIGYLTLKDMLKWLRDMFNVYWRVEGTDFRLEHISYFEGTNGEDLTSTQPTIVNNRNSFTFDNDKLIPRESFSWMDPTTDPDFAGLDIVYPNSCTDPELEPEETTLDRVFTDLGRVDSLPDSVSDEGFFFLATDLISATYYINRETGEGSGDIKANAHLSWANLHENYLTWGRMQATGTLNNVSQTFNSYKRSKRQQPIQVLFSVSDFFALDLTDKLKTEIGWGDIEKGTFSATQCRYNVDLLHDD